MAETRKTSFSIDCVGLVPLNPTSDVQVSPSPFVSPLYSGAPSSSTPEEVIRGPILTAQMMRDRRHLAEAQVEIAALRDRIHHLEGILLRRAYKRVYTRVKQFYHCLPPELQGAIRWLRNRWLSTAGPSPLQALSPMRGRALVIDDRWPRPDRDSGSVDIVNLVQALDHLGFEVVLAAAREHDGTSLARDALISAGLRCLLPSDAASVEDFLARQGETLDLCVLCRVYCGGRFLEAVHRNAMKSRIVFNSVDLHFLRIERQARVECDDAALAVARQVREREEEIIRASDATIVVSKAEFNLLMNEIPEALVEELPLARVLVPPATPFASRAGIGFIGGFAHAPNVDAMRYFLAAIWPLILSDLPEVEMTIVGSDFPDKLLDGVPGRVRSLGHLADVAPWFEELRLTVAPLRFGSGAKGKLASSLSAGVPCIATSIATEGMSLSDASGVLIAEDPFAFAARVREAYTDEALWIRLSSGALTYARETLSISGWRSRFDTMLRRIGL